MFQSIKNTISMKKILFFASLLVFNVSMFNASLAQNAKLPQGITLKDLNGASVQSSAIQNDGKPVIISFWATWCKPCNKELNNIKEVYEDWQSETGVKLVAVSIDDARSASRVKPHVDGNDWPFEVYIDQNSDLKRAMGVPNVPHTFILNGNGEIVWQHNGYQDGGEEEVIEKVRELLK